MSATPARAAGVSRGRPTPFRGCRESPGLPLLAAVPLIAPPLGGSSESGQRGRPETGAGVRAETLQASPAKLGRGVRSSPRLFPASGPLLRSHPCGLRFAGVGRAPTLPSRPPRLGVAGILADGAGRLISKCRPPTSGKFGGGARLDARGRNGLLGRRAPSTLLFRDAAAAALCPFPMAAPTPSPGESGLLGAAALGTGEGLAPGGGQGALAAVAQVSLG